MRERKKMRVRDSDIDIDGDSYMILMNRSDLRAEQSEVEKINSIYLQTSIICEVLLIVTSIIQYTNIGNHSRLRAIDE